jgi:hypothetical protein
MDDSSWRPMIEALQQKGFRSNYLERLQRRLQIATGRESLEQEMLQEMAASLGRAEDRINVALLRCEVLGRELDEVEAQRPRPDDYAGRVAAFNAQRDEALRFREYLLIQREAIGLRNNAQLETLYPLPPRRVVQP